MSARDRRTVYEIAGSSTRARPPAMSWRDRAECRADPNPSWWDTPLGYRELAAPDAHTAICRRCPVVRECAADAVDTYSAGTIRAAVAIPADGGTYRHGITRLAVRAALNAVAERGLR